MDPERQARKQNLRVIVSESIMVLAVIALVAVLALVVSGYWLNSDFKVERQGMLQIYSIPTGASVAVDGDAPWFQRTNTSKILSSGEHQITLTKEGYDSWSKTINISEGLLYKLSYPRLFLKERTKEIARDVATTTFATVSPNHKLLLLANNTTSWSLIHLDNEELKSTTIDLSPLFTDDTTTEIFSGEILSAEWDSTNEHVLLRINLDSQMQWILLNIRDTSKNINLTEKFAQNFSDVRIFDNSASNLLCLVNGNLHKIDVDARQISSIIASDVQSYDFYESEIVFSSKEKISVIKNPSAQPVTIDTITAPAQVAFARFYENDYLFIVNDGVVKVYDKDDYLELQNYQLTFTPSTIKVGPEGSFVFLSQDSHFATIDMEAMALSEWSIDTSHFGWLNGYMLYAVKDGALSVYDFDGLNHRTLATNVSERFPITITNDKWLYYFSDGNLIREWLVNK